MFEIAKAIGATIGVDVHSVDQHASGAWVLHTSVGKGYLPDDLDVADENALTVAVTDVLTSMQLVAEGPAATGETPEQAWAKAEEMFPAAPVAPKHHKGRKTKVAE